MSSGKTIREKVLDLLGGNKSDDFLCFSGMGNVTTEGMKHAGIAFAEAHTDARKMASLAASTYRLFGFQCAVVPFDVAIEAEIAGCSINFYTHVDPDELLYPTVKSKIPVSASEIRLPEDIANAGRMPVVREAIGLLKRDIGDEAPIGTYIMGPFTIAGQTMELNDLLKLCLKKLDQVSEILDIYSDLVIRMAEIFFEAGADYVTIREMGATSDVLRPALFTKLVEPSLKRIFDNSPRPLVLHICGKTNGIIESMNRVGASALSVDQKNDLRQTRDAIGPEPILLGNVDPYNILVRGTPEDIERVVMECAESGADALWPGCDIWPTVPAENMRALMRAAKSVRKK